MFQIFKDFGAHKAGYLEMNSFFLKLSCWGEASRPRLGLDQDINALRDQANKIVAREAGKN